MPSHRRPFPLLLALGPFAIPIAAALYLRARWNEIPERFPVHWGMHGKPDGWACRSVNSVGGPLIFAAGLMTLLLLLAVALHYGSRPSPQLLSVVKVLAIVMYFLGAVFSGVALMPLLHISPLVLVAALPLLIIAILILAVRQSAGPGAPVETTPDEAWRLGFIYYNPQDPALFVPKRYGLGYTFNFGRRLAWIVLTCFVVGLVNLVLFLVSVMK